MGPPPSRWPVNIPLRINTRKGSEQSPGRGFRRRSRQPSRGSRGADFLAPPCFSEGSCWSVRLSNFVFACPCRDINFTLKQIRRMVWGKSYRGGGISLLRRTIDAGAETGMRAPNLPSSPSRPQAACCPRRPRKCWHRRVVPWRQRKVQAGAWCRRRSSRRGHRELAWAQCCYRCG